MTSITPTRPPTPRSQPARPRSGPGAVSAPTIDPFRVLRRHWLGIMASGVIGGGLGVVVWIALIFIYPLYSDQVYFEVQPGVAKANEVGARDIAQEDTVTRLATTEMRLMIARPVLLEAIKSPDIVNGTELKSMYPDGKGGLNYEEAVDDLVEDLSVGMVRNSNLFMLRWSTHWDKDVPLVLNKIADTYLVRRGVQEGEIYDKNLKLFESEFQKTSREIDDLREEIAVFIREKGITALDDPRFNQLSLKMTELVRRIGQAREQQSMIETGYASVQAKLEGTLQPTSEDRYMAEADGIIQRQAANVLALKTEIERLKSLYLDPQHYAIQSAERNLASHEAQLATAIDERIQKNLSAQVRDLANQRNMVEGLLADMGREYDETDASLRDLAADMSRYLDMEKRRDLLELKRDESSSLISEARLMKLRADAARLRIASYANTPRELSFPLPELMVPLVAVVVVLCTIGCIFFFELTDQRVKTTADLAVIPGARVLGVVPDLEEDPTHPPAVERVVQHQPGSILSESFRQIASQVARGMSMSGHQSLVVIGGMPDSGTTAVTTNLAACLAAGGRRVVVVDANFRRPSLASAMGVPAEGPGLGDLLSRGVTLDQAVVSAGGDIDVIRAGTPATRIFERLQTAAFSSLLAELRGRYDIMLIDSPPAVVAGEALALASHADAAVMVVAAHREQRGLVARLISQLTDTQCELLGLILNRARGTVGGYFKKNYATMAEYAKAGE